MQEILETLTSLFKSQMKETNLLRASTSTKTQRCKKMDLLQEQESNHRSNK
jgi:hypothetical protein